MEIINNTDEFTEVIEQNTIVIVDFYADWCRPCQALLPILEKIEIDFKDRVKMVKVNVDQHPDLTERFGIGSLPTLIFYQSQKLIDKIVGVQSKTGLVNRILKLENTNHLIVYSSS